MIKYSNSQYGEKDNGYKQEHMNIVMKNYNKTCLKYKQGNIFLFQIVIVSFIFENNLEFKIYYNMNFLLMFF